MKESGRRTKLGNQYELQTIINNESHKRNKAALALMWDLSGRKLKKSLIYLFR